MNERMAVLLSRVQGWFYVLTGVWAIVDIDSFQRVTGPKTDLWLVKTVGVLVIVIGAALIAAAHERRFGLPLMVVAIGSPLGLAAIDLIYALGGRISAIYLLDAAAELVLAGAWVFVCARRLAGPAASG